jgi:roundabout axon guidance receptor 2
VCQVENVVGVRQSSPATLQVLSPPILGAPPQDLSVKEGQDATLRCQVEGDPLPEISWSRDSESSRDLDSRAVTDQQGNLRIYSVLSSDEGLYTCTARNPAGSTNGTMSLLVHAEPMFLQRPSSQTVGLNGVAELSCAATGSPRPTVFWTREGDQNLMFPGTAHGILQVEQDCSLIIN